MKKKCIAMLLAGGQGSRLYALTSKVAKPAVPFGGKYRIIDFPLSNCVNSGIDTVGVLTQYRPLELNAHIGIGQPWDLDISDGGVHVLQPYATSDGGQWYKGTANAIYQNMAFIRQYDPDYVLVLSGDHVYKMDYSKMLKTHISKNASVTVSVIDVPYDEASRFGIVNVDENDLITEFEEKPAHPKSTLASMGIYIFSWKAMEKYLLEDEADSYSDNDFGKNILPNMLSAGETMAVHRFVGYWKDVGTITSLWDANMDMLSPQVLDLFDKSWPIYSRNTPRPPHYTGKNAAISHSILTEGCTIYGTVENSVLFNSVTVSENATVRYSILMPGVTVEPGAVVEYAIVAENTRICKGAHVGADPDAVPISSWGIATCASDITIGPGVTVPSKAILYNSVGEEEIN